MVIACNRLMFTEGGGSDLDVVGVVSAASEGGGASPAGTGSSGCPKSGGAPSRERRKTSGPFPFFRGLGLDFGDFLAARGIIKLRFACGASLPADGKSVQPNMGWIINNRD
jgi:hypothetical protein